MDHEFKQRLIGAVVVTALAAIFIPMMFDDPVDTSGKEVTELTIPPTPNPAAPETSQNLPQNKDQVLNRPDTDLKVTEVDEGNQSNALDSQKMPEPGVKAEQPAISEGNADISSGSPAIPSTVPGKDKVASPDVGSGLDTGYVGGAAKPEVDAATSSPSVEDENTKQLAIAAPVEAPVSRPVQNEKSTSVTAHDTEKPKEKIRHSDTLGGNKDNKTGSKLVRYSIQAGSFNKRENAEALAAKLRKQGMPATIISKGDFFRVKIGPSLDKAKAKEMKAKLEQMNISGLLTSD